MEHSSKWFTLCFNLTLNNSKISNQKFFPIHNSLVFLFIFALILRGVLLLLGFTDYWGDAHHNLIISKLTLDNGFIYSDFKDRHLTWLPLYRYWGTWIIWLTGNASLWVMNIANILLGSLTVVVGTRLAIEISDRKIGIMTGVAMACMPYLMVFSYISMAEMLGGLLLISWCYFVLKEKTWLIFVIAFLATLTRYELIVLLGVTSILMWFFLQASSILFYHGRNCPCIRRMVLVGIY